METTLIPKCDGGLRIVGDSMYPLLKSGDIVFYKQVHDIMHSIIWGEMYLISFDIDGDEIRLYLSDINYVACGAVIRVVREKHQDIKRRLRYVQLTAERLADCVIRRRKFLREVYSHVHAIISLQI